MMSDMAFKAACTPEDPCVCCASRSAARTLGRNEAEGWGSAPDGDETWTPLTRLGPGPLSREEMDRQLQGVVDRLIARTRAAVAPVEEKEGSEEPNPLVGEKAPDSAGATPSGLVARLAVRWVDEAGIAGSYLHPRHVEWVRLLLLALADELWGRGEYQVAHILRSEAER